MIATLAFDELMLEAKFGDDPLTEESSLEVFSKKTVSSYFLKHYSSRNVYVQSQI